MPTESRISAGSTASGECATDTWVIAAGISISDSTPPSDSASVNRRVASQIRDGPLRRRAAVTPPGAGTNETIPPNAGSSPSRIWRAATAARGCAWSPRSRPG